MKRCFVSLFTCLSIAFCGLMGVEAKDNEAIMPLTVVEPMEADGTTRYYLDCSARLSAEYDLYDFTTIQNVNVFYVTKCAIGWSCETARLEILENKSNRKHYRGTADFYMLNTYRGTVNPEIILVS